MNRHRSWCLTINNWTEADLENIRKDNHIYAIAGKECVSTPHLQITLQYRNATRFQTIKNKYPTAHIEPCNDLMASIKYCMKENNYVEFGERPNHKPGKRTDLEMVKEMFKENKTLGEIVNACTSLQGVKYAETMAKYQPNKVREEVEVTWIHGETGSGKTKQAIEDAGDKDYWISSRNLKWWDGYYGQEYVIIDDFRGDFCTFHELLRILDRYPFRVETKGGSQPLRATKIVVTSCFHPRDIYQTREDINQLLRRIHKIIDKSYDPEVGVIL